MAATLTPAHELPLHELPDRLFRQRAPEALRAAVSNSEFDCRYLAKLIADVQCGEAWKRLAPTWDVFCRDFCASSPEFIDAMFDGAELLGFERPISAADAVKAGREAGKKQREIADDIGISQQRVSQLTNDTLVKMVNPGKQVRLNNDPAKAAQTIIKARGLAYARKLAAAITEID